MQKYGILLCNTNPDLPALEDIGCGWGDVTELIDRQELFYCKAFRKRTTYLSKETYYLLKEVRQKKPLTPWLDSDKELIPFNTVSRQSVVQKKLQRGQPMLELFLAKISMILHIFLAPCLRLYYNKGNELEVCPMEEPTLRLEPKRYTGESTVVSMRMPRDMVQELDQIAAATGYTRTELMMICLEFSMNHMEIVQKETNGRA